MSNQRARTGRRLVLAALGVLITGFGYSIANAHDFGGPSSGGGGDPPPPDPPCNSCPCAGPGGGGGGPGNSNGNPGGSGGKPVSFFNGAEEMVVTDMTVQGTFPIVVQRKYDSRSSYDSPLGFGWAFIHDRRLYEYPDGSVLVRHGCGTRDRYVHSGGAYVTPVGSMLSKLAELPDGNFQLNYLNGITDTYDSQGRLTATADSHGNRHEFTYDSRGKLPLVGSSKEAISQTQPMTVAYNYRLTRIDVRSADGALTGRYVTFEYDESTGRLTSVTADDGRTVSYQHDTTQSLTLGNLTQASGLEGVVATYAYADPLDAHNLTSITAAPGRAPVVNTYDAQDRVTRQEEGTRRMDIVYNVPYTRTTVTRTIRDHNGLNPYTAATVYEFDTSGRVTKLTDALGHETRYAYNTAKLLSSKEIWQKTGATLALLQAVSWTYDAGGNKLTESVTLDSGEIITRSWTYEQDWVASDQMVSSTSPAKVFRTEYTFHYGAGGRPENIASMKRRKDDGSFQITTYDYDSRNRLLTTTQPDGVQEINEYTGDYVTRAYFAVGGVELPQVERRMEYDARGNLIKQWDARGNLTQYQYDDRGRQVLVTNPLGEQSIHTYEDDQLTQIEEGHTAADGEGQVTRFSFDTRGQLIGIQRKNDAGVFVNYQTYQLDSEGRRLTVADGAGRETRFNYDLVGRIASVVEPGGRTTTLAYDAAGNRVSIIDAMSREVRYEFDDLNRMTAVVQRAVTPNLRTTMTYDAMSNLLSLTNPEGRTTSYAFDALNRNSAITQPMGDSVGYAYDERNRLARIVNARGHKIGYEYYDWGGLSGERHYPTVSATAPTRTISYAYDADGNMTGTTDDAVQATPLYSLTYDALSRAYDETVRYIPGGDKVLQHRYDRFGNRRQLTLQDALPVTNSFVYNKLNQVASASLAGQSIGFSYYGSSDRQSITLPNGVSENFTYRSDGPLQSLTVTGPSGPLAQLGYTYDDVLNIDTQTDQYGTHQFDYDALGRLTQTSRPGSAGVANESYAYDGVGNREDPSNAALYAYDNNNRMTASPGRSYTYDADGNLQTRSDGAQLVHNARNRLVSFTRGAVTASYLHDSSGRRIRKTVNGVNTWFLWDGQNMLAVYDGSGSRVARYGYVENDYVPLQLEDNGERYFVHADHLRTPRFITDASGEVVWLSRHEAFGAAVVDADPDGDGQNVRFDLRFPGQYYDAESGLHYNHHRDYDPATGRYVQSDPVGLAAGINTYAYVSNDPLRNLDPLGLEKQITGRWLQPPKLNITDYGIHWKKTEIVPPSWSWWGYIKFVRLYGHASGYVNIDIGCTATDECGTDEWEIHQRLPVAINGHIDVGPNLYALIVGFRFGPVVGLTVNIVLAAGALLHAEYHFLSLLQNEAALILGEAASKGPTAICKGEN